MKWLGGNTLRKLVVSLYNEQWIQLFMEEAEKLNFIFKNEIIDIYHIGSTSVPGLKSKPIIDILPVVKDIHHVDNFNLEMQKIGYVAKGENGITQRRYFQKGGDNRTHHVHFYQIGSGEITRHLAFRDYLISHPDEMKLYGDLKERLAQQFPNNMKSYIAGKDYFAKELERKALAWYDGR